jgi:hypothetical protein
VHQVRPTLPKSAECITEPIRSAVDSIYYWRYVSRSAPHIIPELANKLGSTNQKQKCREFNPNKLGQGREMTLHILKAYYSKTYEVKEFIKNQLFHKKSFNFTFSYHSLP